MKRSVLLFLFLFFTVHIIAQKIDNINLKTGSNTIKIIIIDIVEEDLELSFSTIKSDTLSVSLYLPEKHSFKLYSDIDTTRFILPIDHSVTISVEKENNKPVIINLKNGLDYKEIQFEENDKDINFNLVYEENNNNLHLQELRSKYPIDSLASLGNSDIEKVRQISSWVHNLWKHDGMNEPEKKDALYILEEVKKGRRFRCVEYGIVTTACLNSIGIKARTLSLKTEDVETRPSGAGHVLLEVYIDDLNKWVMVDPQWDIIPHLEGVPLNAVELQSAITHHKELKAWTTENITIEEYIPWIYQYLYYFSVKFDNRENIGKNERYTYQGKSDIMLMPLRAKEPTVFQQKYPIDYCFYTHSLKDFYSKP